MYILSNHTNYIYSRTIGSYIVREDHWSNWLILCQNTQKLFNLNFVLCRAFPSRQSRAFPKLAYNLVYWSVISVFYNICKTIFRNDKLKIRYYWYNRILTRWRASTTPWRNGSASDSRSEGCVFESRRGQGLILFLFLLWFSLLYQESWILKTWHSVVYVIFAISFHNFHLSVTFEILY